MERDTIITFTLGRYHELDYQVITKRLQELGINRYLINIKPLIENYSSENEAYLSLCKLFREQDIPFEKIAFFDLRHCRGWANIADDFLLILTPLERFAQEQNGEIAIENKPEMFRWIKNKGNYVELLHQKSISTVDTEVVEIKDENAVSRLIGVLEKNIYAEYNSLIIKPNTGAGAQGLIKIDRVSNSLARIYEPKPEDRTKGIPSQTIITNLDTHQALFQFIEKYLKSINDDQVLVQPFLESSTEYSLLKIGNFLTLVEKKPGSKEGDFVNHERFDGINSVMDYIPLAAKSFTQNVLTCLPEAVRNPEIIRIDYFVKDGSPIILEIEAGAMRIFPSSITHTLMTDFFVAKVTQRDLSSTSNSSQFP